MDNRTGARDFLAGVSEQVLDAVAAALQLEEADARTCSTWPAPPVPASTVAGRSPGLGSDPSSSSFSTA